MHLHQKRRALACCRAVVGAASAIRRSHLAQHDAGAFHHVGHAKRPADLDQLSAAHDHFVALPAHEVRVEQQIDRGGAVVHNDAGLGTGHAPEQIGEPVVALVALPRLAIDLEDAVRTGDRPHRRRSFRVQGRTSKSSVQHDARGVDHAHDAGTPLATDGSRELVHERRARQTGGQRCGIQRSGLDFAAPTLDQRAEEREPDVPGHARSELHEARIVRQFLDRRQQSEGFLGGVGARGHAAQNRLPPHGAHGGRRKRPRAG